MNTTIQHQPTAFSGLLKTWRSRQRFSQLDLALEAGLSQRHISFLETGRSKPSRYAVSQLGEALNMPAAEVDAMLTSAGFAARSSDTRWREADRLAINASIDHVLIGHEPYPAVAIDRMWNLKKPNNAAVSFFAALGSSGDPNLLREFMKPGAVRDKILNWQEVVRALTRLYGLEVARRPNDIEAQNLLKELLSFPGVADAANVPTIENPAPVLAIQFHIDNAILNLFSLIATIGMSADASIDDIRIETLLPADEKSKNWFGNE
ncbi:transcriptional regulator, XRE family [hydrothermal vent metagenome]|uniref:Transcriptional regulator, XRE family n=1 Tax=hydrothermal vent metagenome TaxID=652676 RepID=A0A3B0U3X1_9ZZZZ